MPFVLRWLAARWFRNRMLGRGGGGRRGGYGSGGAPWGGGYGLRGGRQMARRGYGRPARRGRVGLFGPFPYYSARTRGGSRVTVGGCCLPLALALLAVPLTGVRLLVRRWV